jgi:hypothetical protein
VEGKDEAITGRAYRSGNIKFERINQEERSPYRPLFPKKKEKSRLNIRREERAWYGTE